MWLAWLFLSRDGLRPTAGDRIYRLPRRLQCPAGERLDKRCCRLDGTSASTDGTNCRVCSEDLIEGTFKFKVLEADMDAGCSALVSSKLGVPGLVSIYADVLASGPVFPGF